MYHLIQASRLEKQEAAAANEEEEEASSFAPIGHGKNGGDGMDFLRKDDFAFIGRPPRSTAAPSFAGSQLPIVAPDYDDAHDGGEPEGVFELDDF